MNSSPALAVVTTNERSVLQEFFQGQADTAAALGVPIVVVDNASTDGSPDLVRELGGNADLVVVENDRNLGYAGAVNRAFDEVPGQDLLVLNPDVDLQNPADVESLAGLLDRVESAGAVAPRLVYPDGSPQASARSFPTPLAMAGHSSFMRHFPPARKAGEVYASPPAAGEARRVDWAIGAALLIRREAYDQVGGWDERFFQYLEDTDFCFRLARHGWETWYLPAVQLRHVYPRSSDGSRGGVFSSPERRRHFRSMVQFFAAHPSLAVRRGRKVRRQPAP